MIAGARGQSRPDSNLMRWIPDKRMTFLRASWEHCAFAQICFHGRTPDFQTLVSILIIVSSLYAKEQK
jgi:hypothetical protein